MSFTFSSFAKSALDNYYDGPDNTVSTMTRSTRRGPWLPEEDQALLQLVRSQGANNWVRISQQLQQRSPKQCRERYHQNLKPSLKHDPISAQEGETIERLVQEMGKRWAEIARRLGNRSDNAVKNWWNGSVNRRRRNPAPTTHGFKHVGTRLQPIPYTCSLERTIRPCFESHESSQSRLHGRAVPNFRANRPSNLLIAGPTDTNHSNSTSNTSPRSSQNSNETYFQSTALSGSYPPRSALSQNQNWNLRPELPPLRSSSLSSQTGDGRSMNNERPPISPALSDISQRHAPSLVSDSQSSSSISPKTVTTPRPGVPAPVEISHLPWSDAPVIPNAISYTKVPISLASSSGSQDTLDSGYHKHVTAHQFGRSRDSRMHVSTLLE